MKRLTISRLASARLKANRRAYRSLAIGIFLAVFLVAALCLSMQGIFLAQRKLAAEKVGCINVLELDAHFSGRDFGPLSGWFDRVGHVYVTAKAEDTGFYLGWYGEEGAALMNRRATLGRLPHAPGEIAIEPSALEILAPKAQLGDSITLTLLPIDGQTESRRYTLVGILAEQSPYLDSSSFMSFSGVSQFPAMMVCPEDTPFATGRTVCHRVMTLKPGRTRAALLRAANELWGGQDAVYFRFLSVNAEGKLDMGYGFVPTISDEVLTLLATAVLLAGSLLIACCVGIVNAMESRLAHSREEIGLLRAVGATRRQIRRIFGRESLLLALVVAPAALALACLFTWGLAQLAPRQVVFQPSPWLLIPIGLISALTVMLAAFLPLRRASRMTPMSALRDIDLLRKTSRLRSRKVFDAPALIARRQLRLHPSRQLGSALLVMLTLLCAAMLTAMILLGGNYIDPDSPDFSISNHSTVIERNFRSVLPGRPLSQQDIAQLRSLPHVKDVKLSSYIRLNVAVDGKPATFTHYPNTEYGNYHLYDTQEDFIAGMAHHFPNGLDQAGQLSWAKSWLLAREDYAKLRETFSLGDRTVLNMDLDAETLSAKDFDDLGRRVTEGRIDRAALDSGREVLVYMPDLWHWVTPDGMDNYCSDPDFRDEGAELIAYNESFHPGDAISLLQLYSTEEAAATDGSGFDGWTAVRQDVTVGAVLNSVSPCLYSADPCIITTEKGLQNLGFYSNAIDHIEIFLSDAVDRDTEDFLESRITTIARRSPGSQIRNHLAAARDNARSRLQGMLVFACISLVFFSSSVGLIVSGVTRRITADGRMIGMLRAVGADARAVGRCYRAQMTASVVIGWLLGLLLTVLVLPKVFYLPSRFIPYTIGVVTLLAAACLLCCQGMLHLRIREVVQRSIIENIREL